MSNRTRNRLNVWLAGCLTLTTAPTDSTLARGVFSPTEHEALGADQSAHTLALVRYSQIALLNGSRA